MQMFMVHIHMQILWYTFKYKCLWYTFKYKCTENGMAYWNIIIGMYIQMHLHLLTSLIRTHISESNNDGGHWCQ